MLGTAPLAITEGGGTLPWMVPSALADTVSGRSVEEVEASTACSAGLEEGFQVGLWTPG